MTEYYECHVTFSGDGRDESTWEQFVKDNKWKFSVLVGDPLLGPGPRMYATTHFNIRHSLTGVWLKVQDLRKALEAAGATVTRCKIEGILKDERYS